ncbi:MAG: dockerin type I repeat-containing protein, partial [Planctomycetes bacterium]|nr:dockerin type I repeat-containing protein [Planctomycetota bacterium]
SFTSIEITRVVGTDTEKVATLAGNETQWVDTTSPTGVAEYTVAAQPSSGAPTRSCEAVVGFGHLVRKARHQGTNPFAMTIAEAVDETPARVIVAELTGDEAYLYSKELEPAGSIEAPLPGSRTLGIAWERDTDRLLWVKETANGPALVYTQRDGTEPTTPILLAAPAFRAALGDIAHDPNGCSAHEDLGDEHVCPDDPNVRVNFYWAADVLNDIYFEFKVTENLEEVSILAVPTGRLFNHPSGRGWGDGIAGVVAETFTVFDITVGAQSMGYADRVVRMLPAVNAPGGQQFGLRPTTGSAFIEGIAWTAEGSLGKPAEYAVGNDTNMIYEFSLEISGGGPTFVRGDANGDGRVNISDASSLLQFLFNDGATPGCLKAADANDDGRVNVSDPSYLLIQYLFADAPTPPPAPFPLCGTDPTDDPLGCESYTCK